MASVSALAIKSSPVIAANETVVAAAPEESEFDYAAYFGLFSCEGWGMKRKPGSNECIPK